MWLGMEVQCNKLGLDAAAATAKRLLDRSQQHAFRHHAGDVEGDPRVPRPQSEELHMALRQLGVPTEFFVYPGSTHGIPDPRNQFLKSTAEMAWMDYWVRGMGKKFAWRDVLKTLDDEAERQKAREATKLPGGIPDGPERE